MVGTVAPETESTKIRKDVKDRLRKLGTVEDTYSDVIEMLIDCYERHEEEKSEK